MPNIQEFLQAARTETEKQRFQRDYVAGLISVEELAGRVRLVGDPKSSLVVPYHFRTDQDWLDYYGEASPRTTTRRRRR